MRVHARAIGRTADSPTLPRALRRRGSSGHGGKRSYGANAGVRAVKIPMPLLRRLGRPIEVAYGVPFLAADEASFITGAELVTGGGYVAR